jgi:hypothetical protein
VMRRATAVLLLATVLAVAGGSLDAGAAAGPFRKLRLPPGMGVYEWHNAGDLPIAEARRRLSFLRANGFTTVYLEIGAYLDAAELPPDDWRRRARLDRIRRQIQRFVATASSYGLAVHALGGGPTWTGELRYLGQELVTLVGHYNAKVGAAERLRGVQLDLEPYILDGWLADPQTNFAEYLTTLEGIVAAYRTVLHRHHSRHLQLGFAIPFWFDAQGGAPGEVSFAGASKPVFHHIIDLVGDLPGAYLVVMSYRNRTRGLDGSIALARDEFEHVAGIGARSGLVVGQQYGPAREEEARITFNGQPRRSFRRAAAEIATAFRRYPQFRGVSVDDIDSYMAAGP